MTFFFQLLFPPTGLDIFIISKALGHSICKTGEKSEKRIESNRQEKMGQDGQSTRDSDKLRTRADREIDTQSEVE